MAKADSIYNQKRNFDLTPEPRDDEGSSRVRGTQALRFVVQKHDARALHYDFRLEFEGTLKSWAIPKGPSLDPTHKRMAVRTEDHPMSYAKFEGHIPHGQYGGGEVIVWDEGVWKPQGDVAAGLKTGKLKFTLIGEKLQGDWALVRMRNREGDKKESWLLIKERDAIAKSYAEYDLVAARPESVLTGEVLAIDKKSGKKVSSLPQKTVVKKSTNKASLSQQKVTSIPQTFSPQLATLVSEPPAGDWFYEIKFDGYRMLARVLNGEVKLFTRNGNDWTTRLPEQAKAIASLQLQDSWLDGEVVVLNENGLPSFQALQNAFEIGASQQIIFYLFDAPYLNGEDLREQPIELRRERLKKIIPRTKKSLLRYSETFEADHKSIVQSACAMSLEGVIGKRIGSLYVSRRSDDWIKLKCRLRQEFVIVGYTEPQGSRIGFGALLLAVHKQKNSPELIYAGRVGTGFNTARLNEMVKKLTALGRSTSPLSIKLTAQHARGVHWIKPVLIGEVEFAEWTNEGLVRQASFIALRSDKPVADIIREQPQVSSITNKSNTRASRAKKTANSATTKTVIASVAISHPARIIDSQTGATKLQLAEYYEQVSELILPHLKCRPVSLLRAPDGLTGEQFFQKHAENRAIPHVTQLDKSLDPGHAPLMAIDTTQALVSCVQMNAIELHTWGARVGEIEAPDRFVLDLDPDPALPWRSVIEATNLTLAVLDELKLRAFLKTSGGKGMHILVPLTPAANWETVKAFSKAIAEFMAKQIPDRFVAKMGPKNRVGKIFIDYLRNSRGASTVSAYSVRARPGLPVSVPIAREELGEITRPDMWNIQNIESRLNSSAADAWGIYTKGKYKAQKITASMWKKLGVKNI